MEYYKEYNKDLSLKAQKEFDDQISEFNSSYKLGIDLGDKTGIAIVKDNKIIMARTLIDLHTKKLKDRRDARRNRRTRRSRKKRLARLRSWVLRQKVGDRKLPDPYKIMHDNRYWSIYNKSNSTNKKNWIDLLINSNSLSADDFVRGLTIIFRKRGYRAFKYLSRLSDKEFKKYIGQLVPPISKAEYEDYINELNARFRDGEMDEKELDNLKSKLDDINKESKDFQIKQREEVKEELNKLIELFSNSVDKKIDKERWKKELDNLLDKQVRKIRFDNRFILKCKLEGCNKNTPKKENVRDLSLIAAFSGIFKDNINEKIRRLRDIRNKLIHEYKSEKFDEEVFKIANENLDENDIISEIKHLVNNKISS